MVVAVSWNILENGGFQSTLNLGYHLKTLQIFFFLHSLLIKLTFRISNLIFKCTPIMSLLLILIRSHVTMTSVKCNFDKPNVVSRSESQKLTTWFSLKSQCPTTPTPQESFKEARQSYTTKIEIIRPCMKNRIHAKYVGHST